ncbi:MAG: response regulator [bacterium]
MTERKVVTPTVLVVDDDASNRLLIEVMLAPEGYRTLSASSGDEALAMTAAHLPDLVLLDVMMPGMDGYQVAGRIKADPATRHIPIVMLTALSDRNSIMHGLSAGAVGYITKPVNRAELTARVRDTLRIGKPDNPETADRSSPGRRVEDHGPSTE